MWPPGARAFSRLPDDKKGKALGTRLLCLVPDNFTQGQNVDLPLVDLERNAGSRSLLAFRSRLTCGKLTLCCILLYFLHSQAFTWMKIRIASCYIVLKMISSRICACARNIVFKTNHIIIITWSMPLCTSYIKEHGAARATNKELCFFYCKNKHNLNFIRNKRQLKGYKFDGAKCRWYSL
jgi:hypothetical protein